MKYQTPAVWIISDIHLDIWIHYGWKEDLPDLSQYYDPDRQNVYLILGDTLNGLPLRESQLFAQGMVQEAMRRLSSQGDVFFVLGNHEHYNGVFEDTKRKFDGFFDDMPNVVVIDTAECFMYGDTALIVGSNWPAMSLSDYLMHTTDQPAFLRANGTHVTFGDLEEKGKIHKAAMSEAFLEVAFSKMAFNNLIFGTHFGCAENPSQREIYPNINPYFDPPPHMALIGAVQDYIEKTDCSVIWCYGHSHINENRESIYGGVIRTNQIGYPKEATKLGITNPFTFKRVL